MSRDPLSHQAEAFRNLQTAIMFYWPDAKPKTILVASPSEQEGKTTVAVNLAMSLSKHAATCLIDADIRRPQVGPLFGIDSKDSLSDVLSGAATIDNALHLTQHQNLTVLPAGLNRKAVHWAGSKKIREILDSLTERFDYLVVDCPPLLPFAESRVLATMVDSVILVGRYGATTDEALKLAAQTLRELHAPVMGIVINNVGAESPYYEHYYGPHEDDAGSNAQNTAGRTPQAGVSLAGSVAAVICAVLLGTVVGLGLGWRRTTVAHRQVPTLASGTALTAQNGTGQSGGTQTGSAVAKWDPGTNVVSSPARSVPRNSMAPVSEKKNEFAPPSTPAVRPNVSFPPASALSVYENGNEVFHMPPTMEHDVARVTETNGAEVQHGSHVAQAGILEKSHPRLADDTLLYRVEPEYPEQARQQQIQGRVVLDVRIGGDGAIDDVKLLSGQPLLAEAAIAAVRKWRFKPSTLQGRQVEVQTKVTLNFRIPT